MTFETMHKLAQEKGVASHGNLMAHRARDGRINWLINGRRCTWIEAKYELKKKPAQVTNAAVQHNKEER